MELSGSAPNYRNRRKRSVKKDTKRRLVLAVLVAAIGISSVYGVKEAVVNTYDFVKDTIVYDSEVFSYRDLINKNCHRTNDNQHYFIDTYSLAQDVKKLEVSKPEDVYHHFISIATNIDYNRNENFRTFLNSYDLDSMSQLEIVYPTYQEFSNFLYEYSLLNEDGSINFDKWREYDKKVYNFEKELDDEYKIEEMDGKNL